MSIITRARALRHTIEGLATTLSDSDALENTELFPQWDGNGHQYTIGERVRYNDTLYKVILGHTSQADWTPDIAVSLYVRVDDPSIEWPEWHQPQGAHGAYMMGDKVSHNEKHWTSDIDNNVYEPGVYGWSEQP